MLAGEDGGPNNNNNNNTFFEEERSVLERMQSVPAQLSQLGPCSQPHAQLYHH